MAMKPAGQDPESADCAPQARTVTLCSHRKSSLFWIRLLLVLGGRRATGTLPARPPSSEMRQRLGYAMVGGLALSQFVTLYTTPVIYLYLDLLQKWLDGRRICEEADIRAAAAE
jgi:hypothetical protein